jgi:lipopolysaccharide export LptBFGC system permease protein LptF
VRMRGDGVLERQRFARVAGLLAGVIVLSLGVSLAVRGSHGALANAIDVAIVVLVVLLLILTAAYYLRFRRDNR